MLADRPSQFAFMQMDSCRVRDRNPFAHFRAPLDIEVGCWYRQHSLAPPTLHFMLSTVGLTLFAFHFRMFTCRVRMFGRHLTASGSGLLLRALGSGNNVLVPCQPWWH